jgi:hypothetical protein
MSKSKPCYDRQTVGQYVLMSNTHLEPKTVFLLLSDICAFVDVPHISGGRTDLSFTAVIISSTCQLHSQIYMSAFYRVSQLPRVRFLVDHTIYSFISHAIAQAVSCRLSTAATQIWVQVRLWGICGGQSSTMAGFLRVLRFPLPILIPPTVPHSSSSIIRGWYNRPNSGRSTKWHQYHPTPRN